MADATVRVVRLTSLVNVYVPKTSSTSCDQAIFIDQASDGDVFSDAVVVKVDQVR